MVVEIQVVIFAMLGWLSVDLTLAFFSSERDRAKKIAKFINSFFFALTVLIICFIFASKN